MRRMLVPLFAVVFVFAVAVGQAPAAAPASLQVTAHEFSYTLSRPIVPAGKVYVELDNFGEDAHDLMMQRKEGGPVIVFPETQAGQHTLRILTLKAGHYRLWCGVANHAEIGMRATLVVKAPAAKPVKRHAKSRGR